MVSIAGRAWKPIAIAFCFAVHFSHSPENFTVDPFNPPERQKSLRTLCDDRTIGSAPGLW